MSEPATNSLRKSNQFRSQETINHTLQQIALSFSTPAMQDDKTVQIPIHLLDHESPPTRLDFEAAFELSKRPGTVLSVSADYVLVQKNYPYLHLDPRDPLHHLPKREIFVEFKSEQEAEFVKTREWTLYWKHGPTTFKPITPKQDTATRAKYREIGEKVVAHVRLTQELMDLGAVIRIPENGPNNGLVFGLPDCCMDAPEFEMKLQEYNRELNDAIAARDDNKGAQAASKMAGLARMFTKVNKKQLLGEIKIKGIEWNNRLLDLARINQSETYFTFIRAFPEHNPKWVPFS